MQTDEARYEPAQPVRTMKFLRLADVLERTGIGSKSELYRRIRADEFPKGERISHKMVVWPEPVIARWQYQFLPADLQELLG